MLDARDLNCSPHVCVFVHKCPDYGTVRHTASLLVCGAHTHTHTQLCGIKKYPVSNTVCYQLTHTTLKNLELLKHSKIDKNAPTCFGLHGNHLQGAKVSSWLKVTRLVNSRCVKDVQGVVQCYGCICSHSTDDALHIFHASTVNQTCNF